ncbi:DUF2336 domain-containing protein [Sphingomonas sp. RP10(2022)]|uniref:DUF2336 domain-containing protein n=1 Tax=Sphingomonas liriopis TaxID=2949094 RepID=A0A9X2HLD6_9SPHN|nr:DUF2336 domain-containing protein [Sphingomonas liriopis]MCP3733351.1 DUF2336 domain-containing protein [Sphingomonas liriopis]
MSVGPEQAGRHAPGTRINAARRLGTLADRRLTGAIDDFFLADDVRLDERTRLTLGRMLAAVVQGIETDIRRQAARVLSGRDLIEQAERLLKGHEDVVRRLSRAGLLRDRLLMDELIAQVRCDLIAGALSPAVAGPDQPSLLVRLSEVDDGVVAAAARALLSAEARRRTAAEQGGVPAGTLPAERHHQLVWWVAASIREAQVAAAGDDTAVDRAIVEAAQRSLAAHDEGQRAEAIAMRLAAAIDARADEVGELLVEALGDRRLLLFVAVLGRAVDMDFEGARAIVLEPEGDRLWLALRAAGLDRATIARIGLALADADPRRDIESFADELDAIAAVPVEAARSALAPLTLHHDLRLAIDALAREAAR